LRKATAPKAALRAFTAQAGGRVLTLPDATFPDPTKKAIADLLQDMPNPAGTLGLTLRAPDGIGSARFARYAVTGLPSSADAMGALFDGVTVTATYLPTPESAE
jgi:hypothetical protein